MLAEFGFELNGRLVSDRGVEASPIVDLVDEDADLTSSALSVFINLCLANGVFMTRSSSRRDDVEFAESFDCWHSDVQQGIELRPNVIFLGAGDMAEGAFRLRFQFGSRSFWLVMIEIVVPHPPVSA